MAGSVINVQEQARSCTTPGDVTSAGSGLTERLSARVNEHLPILERAYSRGIEVP